ncbi:MAG: APC family permease [Actinobacteria bacterium]|nr:APC family permease [Actinomycetota bacterium]
MNLFKRLLFGRPLANTQLGEQKLPKTIALAIFSSDAISSTAYATEEILFVTAVAASSLALGLDTLVPIAVVVAILLAIVITSYRQVIFAYPSGGGAYVVSRENIGENASLVAAASLLVDYILTVAVSISAGVGAIISIPEFHDLHDSRVIVGIALIVGITLMNMRGIKESGRVFAIPTYIYMVTVAVLIVYGLVRVYFGDIDPVPFDPERFEGVATGGELGIFLILKGFSSGAVALTGVEAISNGVPSFRRPSPRNAAITLVWMGVILGSLFFGMSLLASELRPYPSHEITVPAQLGLAVFGNGWAFVLLQFATAGILILAANTAYAGFPGLSSIIARDGYLPRQLAHRGDRLVFSNSIIMLAGAAMFLLVAFGGITTSLIPLYAVGVFTGFTLSQFGMVRFHRRRREPGWQRSQWINGIGGTATLVVLLIVGVTKFSSGAWVPIVVIPLIVLLFKGIRRHYTRVANTLRVPPDWKPPDRKNVFVILAHDVNPGVFNAVSFARSTSSDHLVAVTVVADGIEAERAEKQWAEYDLPVPLEVVQSSAGEFTDATLQYVDELQQRWPGSMVTVIIPELYTQHWWQQLLHNQSVLVLKGKLLFRHNTAVTSIPYGRKNEELSAPV